MARIGVARITKFYCIKQYEHGYGLVISGDIMPHGTLLENCKYIVLNLFWYHLNMNLGEDELTIVYRIGRKPINGVDNRKMFLRPTRKQLTHRISYATCELNPRFYINYYLIRTRIKIDYIIRQLKINYPNMIKGYHSYSNKTCILYNICDYSSNVTSTLELDETENRTLDEPENQIMDETENRIIHVTIRTLADLERFISVYINTTIDSYH